MTSNKENEMHLQVVKIDLVYWDGTGYSYVFLFYCSIAVVKVIQRIDKILQSNQ
jgi:hypothetical protein